MARAVSPLTRGGRRFEVQVDDKLRAIPAARGYNAPCIPRITRCELSPLPRVGAKDLLGEVYEYELSPLSRGECEAIERNGRRARAIPAGAGWVGYAHFVADMYERYSMLMGCAAAAGTRMWRLPLTGSIVK